MRSVNFTIFLNLVFGGFLLFRLTVERWIHLRAKAEAASASETTAAYSGLQYPRTLRGPSLSSLAKAVVGLG